MTRTFWRTKAGAVPVFLALLAVSYLDLLHVLPPALAVALAFSLVLILPGWLLAGLLIPGQDADLLERVGLAFAFSLALLVPLAGAVLYLQLNLSAFRVVFLLFCLGLAIVSLLWDRLVGLVRRRIPWLATTPAAAEDPSAARPSWRYDLPLVLLLIVAAIATFTISSGGGLDGDQIAYLGFARGIYDDLPATGLDPLFGTGLPVPPRAAYNPWGVLPPFIARLSGVELADTLGRYLPALLAVVSLAAFYVLAKELTRRRDAALFLVSFQVLFYLAAPFHRHGNLAYAFFRRLASDKFMLLFVVLPVALYLVLRFLRSGRRRWFVLAGLGAASLVIHPIDSAFYAVAAGSLAGLHFLVGPSRSALRRLAGVTVVILLLMAFPLALRQSVQESRSAYLFPATFDNLPLLETPVLVLPNLWEESMQMPGQQPKIVVPPPGAPNPFLVYRLWSQINGQGLLIFSPTTYMSHPDLLWDAGTLLALLLAPLALLRVRRSVLARYILATTVPFLAFAFIPWIAPIVGKVVTPWLLYRFTWPLPVAIILGAAVFFCRRPHPTTTAPGRRRPAARVAPDRGLAPAYECHPGPTAVLCDGHRRPARAARLGGARAARAGTGRQRRSQRLSDQPGHPGYRQPALCRGAPLHDDQRGVSR